MQSSIIANEYAQDYMWIFQMLSKQKPVTDYFVITSVLCHGSRDLSHLLQNIYLIHFLTSEKDHSCFYNCRWQSL